MGMFLNYQKLAENYVPNNLSCEKLVPQYYNKIDPVQESKPYQEYNAKGELIGYFWHYGETLNLEFNIDGVITVESDALILKSAGSFPTETTYGKIGQKAYNIIDLKSWTCTNVISGSFIWTEDIEFTYPTAADKSIYLSPESYLKDKHVRVILYNFRMEPIHTQTFEGTSKIIFNINKELSDKLVKGIYYCSLDVLSDTVVQTVFDSHDCILSVK